MGGKRVKWTHLWEEKEKSRLTWGREKSKVDSPEGGQKQSRLTWGRDKSKVDSPGGGKKAVDSLEGGKK